jgi:hypothetical protein
MALRVGVFFDWQNCRGCAKDAFGPGTGGSVNPLLLAGILAASRAPGQEAGRLELVHIHTGMASQAKDARTYAANRRQFAHWQNSSPCVTVFSRTLTYRGREPVEKGVDVALAIDMVRTVMIDKGCELAILVSADTDQLPTLELLADTQGAAAIEVASWVGGDAPPILDLPHARLRQHRLDAQLYRRTEDRTDYNIARR